MVYFLVDGGMGDSVQVTRHNATNIVSPDPIEYSNNHLHRQPIPPAVVDLTTSSTTSTSPSSTSSSSSSSFINGCNVLKFKKNSRATVVVSKQLRLDDESDEDEIALYPLSNQVSTQCR